MAIGELVDLFPRQVAEKILRQFAQERVAQTVDAFEVLKEENKPFEGRRILASLSPPMAVARRFLNLPGSAGRIQAISR